MEAETLGLGLPRAGRAGWPELVISTQVLQEFYVTVTRKLKRPLPEAEAEAAARDLAALEVVDLDKEIVLRSIAGARSQKISL